MVDLKGLMAGNALIFIYQPAYLLLLTFDKPIISKMFSFSLLKQLLTQKNSLEYSFTVQYFFL